MTMQRAALSLVLILGASAWADDPLPVIDPALAALAIPAEGDPFVIDVAGRLSVAATHTFTRTEAVARLSYLLAYWKKRFNIEAEWHGERVFVSGSVYGLKIQAMFAINDSSVVGFAVPMSMPR